MKKAGDGNANHETKLRGIAALMDRTYLPNVHRPTTPQPGDNGLFGEAGCYGTPPRHGLVAGLAPPGTMTAQAAPARAPVAASARVPTWSSPMNR